MKLTFLPKTARIISLMIVLATMAGTTVQQTVQAQTQNEVQFEAEEAAACVAVLPNGQDFFYDFQGIDLSAEQFEVFDSISVEIGEKIGLIVGGAQGIVDSGSNIVFVPREGANLTNEQMDLIYPTYEFISPTPDKIDSLNEEFGQYGEFYASRRLIYTPEEEMMLKELGQEYNDRLLSIMTPEQQQQYRKNMEVRSRINACSANDPTYL